MSTHSTLYGTKSFFFCTTNISSGRLSNSNWDPDNAMSWWGSSVFPLKMHECPERQAKRSHRQWNAHTGTNPSSSICEYISFWNFHRASRICAIVILIFVIYKLAEIFCWRSPAIQKDECLALGWPWILLSTCSCALLQWKQIEFSAEVSNVNMLRIQKLLLWNLQLTQHGWQNITFLCLFILEISVRELNCEVAWNWKWLVSNCRSFWDFRSSRSCKQELELQPFSGIRNDGNQDAQLVVDKD